VAFVMEWLSADVQARDMQPRTDERPNGYGLASRHAPGGRNAIRRHAGWRHARCRPDHDARASGHLVPHRGTVPTRFACPAATVRSATEGIFRSECPCCFPTLRVATGPVRDDCPQVQQSRNRCRRLRQNEAVGGGERHHPCKKYTDVHFCKQVAGRVVPSACVWRTPPSVRISSGGGVDEWFPGGGQSGRWMSCGVGDAFARWKACATEREGGRALSFCPTWRTPPGVPFAATARPRCGG